MKSAFRTAALWLMALVVTTGLLAGCSNKPPECADAEVVSTMRSLLLGNREGDPEAQAALAETNLTLSEVVSEGYQAEAKKQMCRAKVSIDLPGGDGFSQVIHYSTQRTVDDKSNFLLSVDEGQGIQLVAMASINKAAANRRWGGAWHGQFSCSKDVLADDASGEAFTEQVTAQVKNGDISMPITTRHGVDLLVGTIDERDQSFSMMVPLNFPISRRILISVHGKLTPESMSGAGDLLDRFAGTADLRLRKCEIRLQRESAKEPKAQSAKADFVWQGTFVGQGDGDVTLSIGKARSDGQLPVSLATSTSKTGGNCGGSVDGVGQLNGQELRFSGSVQGMSCEAVIKRNGEQIEVEEGKGCNQFHGSSCGFGASLSRKL